MEFRILIVLVLAAVEKLDAYVSPYPECRAVDRSSRRQCGSSRPSVSECQRRIDTATGRTCCYDDTVTGSVPWCYVSAPDSSLNVFPNGQSEGFAPSNQGPPGVAFPNGQPAGFAPSNQGPPGVAFPNGQPVGFAPSNQGPPGVAFPNGQPVGFAPSNQGPPGVVIPNRQPVGFAPSNQGPPGFVPPNQSPSGFVPPSLGSTIQPPGFAAPTFRTTTPRNPASTTASTVTFAPTKDVFGNTIPSGPVSNLFPTSVPGVGRRTTEDPETALQNLLISLGIEEPDEGPVVVPGDINRTIALCTSIKANQIPPSVQSFFTDAISQCDSINATVSPREAAAFLQQEVNRILAGAGRRPTTRPPARATTRPVSNNFQNLLNLISSNGNNNNNNNGGGNGAVNNVLSSLIGNGNSNVNSLLNSLTGRGTTTPATTTAAPNPLQALLGNGAGGANPLLSSLLGNNNNGGSGTNSLISSLLGNNNNNGGSGTSSLISSLLGNNNNNGGSGTNSLISSLLGNNNNGNSNSLTNTLLQSFIQGQRRPATVRQNQPVGAQLPDFIGTTPAPVYNPLVCNLLFGNNGLFSGLTSGGSTLSTFVFLPYRQNLLRQYGCLSNVLNNPLQLLQGGGLDNLRESLGPLLGLTSSTEDQNIGAAVSGPLDPSLIPPAILVRCLEERGALNAQNNCKVGIHVNIRTQQECYNLGCIYAEQGMCFRCPYVPVSAQVNQQAQPTCNVANDARQACPGFQNTFVLSSVISQQQSLASRSISTNTGTSNTGLSNPGTINPIRANGLGPRTRVGEVSNQARNPQPRQGIFGALGGLGGGLGGLGGLGGSNFQNQFLQRDCESRGCCWDPSTSIISSASSCFARAQPTLPASSADCLSTLTCGQTARSLLLPRIVGGQTQTSQERPWQAIIRMRNSSVVRCSGAIICSQWILTAASCLDRLQSVSSLLGFAIDLNPASLEIFVGVSDPFTPGQPRSAVRIIPHPFYRVTQNIHDIALIQVSDLVTSLTVRPVCLPPYATGPIGTGVAIQVAGYGQTSGTSSVLQSTLREIRATTSDYTACRNIYQTSLPNGGVFCAVPVTSGEDTCVGDGGSPALTFNSATNTYTLVGINFAGSDDCSGSRPMVFVDVAVYREWIRQTTNGCCSVIGGRLGK